MKKITLLILLSFSIHSFAQNLRGKAYYQSKTTVKMDEIGGKNMDENMRKMIAERMREYLEKTFVLTFTDSESIYKEEEKLDAGPSGGMMKMMMGSFSAGAQYKNSKTNQLIEEREFFGKQFLVNDTLANLDWQLENESKQIGEYVVFKATALKKIDANDLSMARRKKKTPQEESADSAKQIDSTKTQPDDPMNEIEVPKEVLVTAWYTPMIPINNGPGEYAGLPGLILELNVYRTTLLCSKIVLKPKEAEKIEPPTKGKPVTREEYNLIVKEKIKEMRENFQGGGRKKGRFGG
ncbi:MAG: GLPGLI family protein [Flavobacteriales bacterium]